jgi:hypothetical protein
VYSGFILPLLQVHLEQIGLMWRILLVAQTDSHFVPLVAISFSLFDYRTLNLWYCNKLFLRLCVVWNKYYKLVLIIGSRV